jgi:hypothetical protein
LGSPVHPSLAFAAKQVEGKAQNALGRVKDFGKKDSENKAAVQPPKRVEDSVSTEEETD